MTTEIYPDIGAHLRKTIAQFRRLAIGSRREAKAIRILVANETERLAYKTRMLEIADQKEAYARQCTAVADKSEGTLERHSGRAARLQSPRPRVSRPDRSRRRRRRGAISVSGLDDRRPRARFAAASIARFQGYCMARRGRNEATARRMTMKRCPLSTLRQP
jgi:hypothetical protein